MSLVPASPFDLTSTAISEAIGRDVKVTDVARVGAEFGFSGETYRVALEGTDVPDAIVAKMWALRDSNDVLELHFYRELADGIPIRLPRFYTGDVDHIAGRAWLVLEALEGFRQGDALVDETIGSVLSLVETLAGIQAACWDRLSDRIWLRRAPRFRRDAEYLASRRTEYLARFGPFLDPLAAGLFDEIPALVPEAKALLSGAPETLLHLDLGLDNVLFVGPDDHPVPIDWARCGRGPGVHDLASILFTIAPIEHFEDVVDRYVTALHEFGVSEVDATKMRGWLSGAMTHEFITMTLGVARWAATTERGLEILERWVLRIPQVVAAWSEFDRALFARLRR